MRNSTKYALVSFLGVVGAFNGLLLFGHPSWFNPFVGVLICVALPFAGAMVAAAQGDKPQQFTIHDPEGQKRCGFPVDDDNTQEEQK